MQDQVKAESVLVTPRHFFNDWQSCAPFFCKWSSFGEKKASQLWTSELTDLKSKNAKKACEREGRFESRLTVCGQIKDEEASFSPWNPLFL